MTEKSTIYLDYASTTPVDPRVASKMMEYLTPDGEFGNPASRSHRYGWKADDAVEEARSHELNDVVNNYLSNITINTLVETNNEPYIKLREIV